jgi:formylglycine-generating enzyme required for sulfatase activity
VEWEYACRAGAVTSRCYGQSIDLLDAYARYQANSKAHVWASGSLFPNDLGLFDMLGNVYEWCQESANGPKSGKHQINANIIIVSEAIGEKNPRFLRGGSFSYLPAFVRSAFHIWYAPSGRVPDIGFRPARTYH